MIVLMMNSVMMLIKCCNNNQEFIKHSVLSIDYQQIITQMITKMREFVCVFQGVIMQKL